MINPHITIVVSYENNLYFPVFRPLILLGSHNVLWYEFNSIKHPFGCVLYYEQKCTQCVEQNGKMEIYLARTHVDYPGAIDATRTVTVETQRCCRYIYLYVILMEFLIHGSIIYCRCAEYGVMWKMHNCSLQLTHHQSCILVMPFISV